jgi:peptidyl-dipeptidase Dcp
MSFANKYKKYSNKLNKQFGSASVADPNPLLMDWNTQPLSIPPFSLIKPEHFQPAIDLLISQDMANAVAIASNPSEPTFENTIYAFENLGIRIDQIREILDVIGMEVPTPEFEQLAIEIGPKISAHNISIRTIPGLFARIKSVYDRRDKLGLNKEDIRLTEYIHLNFKKSGAGLPLEKQPRYKEIIQELDVLMTKFKQNVTLAEKQTIVLNVADLDGCKPEYIEAARKLAIDNKITELDACVITYTKSTIDPLLKYANNRAIREQIWRVWYNRARNNYDIAKQIIKLRSEQAETFGFKTYSAWRTADLMSKTPDRVNELLTTAYEQVRPLAERDQKELEELSGISPLQPWDLLYYTEILKKTKYNFDASIMAPYFSLPVIIGAMFDVANKLFGIHFVHRPDIKVYHEDAKVYEVREIIDGVDTIHGVLVADYFNRPGKRSSAWSFVIRNTYYDGKRVLPIIVNHVSLTKPADGEPSLLTFTDAIQLFHEFGHGLHGILSISRYRSLAGMRVIREFVEFASQIFEKWIGEPSVLLKYAKHHITGEVLPKELLDRFNASMKCGLAARTTRFIGCCITDQMFHSVPSSEVDALNLDKLEDDLLEKIKMPSCLVYDYRSTYFGHIFGQDNYPAAIYAYMWADILVDDAYEAFKEKNDPFDPELSKRLRTIYNSGNTVDPNELFRNFRGRDYKSDAFFKNMAE